MFGLLICLQEDEVEEDQEMGRDCKQPKKKRSSEVHNLNERVSNLILDSLYKYLCA